MSTGAYVTCYKERWGLCEHTAIDTRVLCDTDTLYFTCVSWRPVSAPDKPAIVDVEPGDTFANISWVPVAGGGPPDNDAVEFLVEFKKLGLFDCFVLTLEVPTSLFFFKSIHCSNN